MPARDGAGARPRADQFHRSGSSVQGAANGASVLIPDEAVTPNSVKYCRTAIDALERRELPPAVCGLVGPVKAALAAYNSSFESYSTNLLKSDELFWKDMLPLVIAMQRRLSEAEAILVREADGATAESLENIARVTAGQESISALALLFGTLITFLISRSVG